MCRPAAAMLLTGWALVFAHDPDAASPQWKVLSHHDREWVCDEVRTHEVETAALREIGLALAQQEPENPIRQQAYGRALARVRGRYRCERE